MNSRTEQKERSHQSILDSAARLVRDKGIAGARVADVMQGAGLTVGAFYAHFASKDVLVDEALGRTAARLRDRLFARLDEKPEAERARTVLDRYLSAAHRDSATLGCPLPAVAGEVGNSEPQHRGAVVRQIEELVSGLSRHLPEGGIVPGRMLAIGLVALMYGGLTLSRAVRGTNLSDEVLRACRALGAAVVPTKGAKR